MAALVTRSVSMLQIWRSPVTSPASQWCCTYNRLSGATRQPLRQTGGDSRAMMGTPGASQHAHSQAFNAVAAQVYADEQFGKLTSQIQNHLALLGKPVQCKVRNWLKKLREEASYVAATPPPPPRCRRRCLPACLPPPGMDPPNFNFLAPCACRPPMWCGNVTATLMPGCCWSSCGAARWPSRSRRCRPTARCPRCPSTSPMPSNRGLRWRLRRAPAPAAAHRLRRPRGSSSSSSSSSAQAGSTRRAAAVVPSPLPPPSLPRR